MTDASHKIGFGASYEFSRSLVYIPWQQIQRQDSNNGLLIDCYTSQSHNGNTVTCALVRILQIPVEPYGRFWKVHPASELNPAASIRVAEVMNPGLGSWRSQSESRVLKCSVGILFRMQTVRLPNRIKWDRAEYAHLLHNSVSWHAWPITCSRSRAAHGIHPSRHRNCQEDCGSTQQQDLPVKQAIASLYYPSYFQERRLAQLDQLYKNEQSTTRRALPVIKIHE